MKSLAVVAVVLICLLVVGLQHLFNYFLRQDISETPLPIVGAVGILMSLIILFMTIYNIVLIF